MLEERKAAWSRRRREVEDWVRKTREESKRIGESALWVKWEDVVNRVAQVSQVPLSEIASPVRLRRVVRARQACMYLGRLLTTHTVQEIGRRLGGRDHSTVIYGDDRVRDRIRRGDHETVRLISKALGLLEHDQARIESEVAEQETVGVVHGGWTIHVVDPDPAGSKGPAGHPGLRVNYTRPDGTRFSGIVPMSPLNINGTRC